MLGHKADGRRRDKNAGVAHQRDQRNPRPRRQAGLVAGGGEDDRHHVGDADAGNRKGGDDEPGTGRDAAGQHADGGDEAGITQRADRAKPVAHAVAEEAHDGHGSGEEGECEARDRHVRTELFAQIQRSPIQHRAFRDHRKQRHEAENVNRRALWPDIFRLFGMLLMMVRFGDHERHGGERGEQRQPGCDQRMALNAEPGDQKATNAAADKAAKAPEPVRGGHDGTVQPRLDLHRISVHRHIHRAEARAKKNERRDGERNGRREHDQGK